MRYPQHITFCRHLDSSAGIRVEVVTFLLRLAGRSLQCNKQTILLCSNFLSNFTRRLLQEVKREESLSPFWEGWEKKEGRGGRKGDFTTTAWHNGVVLLSELPLQRVYVILCGTQSVMPNVRVRESGLRSIMADMWQVFSRTVDSTGEHCMCSS
jgi:hypothetical protein